MAAVTRDIPELTGLRIAAALCVVVAHLHGLGNISAAGLHSFLDGGRPAVAFFFVLSGVIMTLRYSRLDTGDGAALRRYAWSRFSRLYPTLVLALVIALPTGLYWAITGAGSELLEHYAIRNQYPFWLSVSAAAQGLAVTGWLPVAAINQPWNSPAWSLSCEFFFYLMFPFIRPGLNARSSRSLAVLLCVAWVVQGLWMAAIHEFMPPNRAGFLMHQFPLTRLFEFMLGVCSGILLMRLERRQMINWAIAMTSATVLMTVALGLSGVELPVSYTLAPLFAAMIVVVVKFSGAAWLALLRVRLVVALGHASYALYMIHLPILLAAAATGIVLQWGWIWVPLLLLASLAVHYWYSEPVRHFLMNRVNSARVATRTVTVQQEP